MNSTNYTVAKLVAASTAPKTTPGQMQDALRQHHNVINGLPATPYSDWDESKRKLANQPRKQP